MTNDEGPRTKDKGQNPKSQGLRTKSQLPRTKNQEPTANYRALSFTHRCISGTWKSQTADSDSRRMSWRSAQRRAALKASGERWVADSSSGRDQRSARVAIARNKVW